MGLKKKYTWMWLLWIFAFGVIEWSALKNDTYGDTLTEHVRVAIGTMSARKALNWVARIGLAGLFIWLIPHFFTGTW